MLFQKTQICFNEPHYVQNGSKNATMFLSDYYLALVGKGLLQGHNGKCCSLVKLCIHFHYFIPLNHG